MNKSDSIFLIGLAIFSILTSFMFIYYGVGVLTGPQVAQPLTIFAYVTAGYGLANIYLLSFAWRAKLNWTVIGNKLIGLCYFGIFVFDRVNDGFKSSLQIVGIAAVAGILLLNWFTIKKLVQRPDEPC